MAFDFVLDFKLGTGSQSNSKIIPKVWGDHQ